MKRQQTYKGLIGKADNRKLAKARLKQIERQQIRKELDEYEL